MTVLVVAALVVSVASAVHGAVGFGMNLLAVPLLLLLEPALVPGPSLAAGLVVSMLVAARERTPVDRRLSWALLGLLPGTTLAVWVLTAVPADALSVLLGGLVIIAVLLSALRLHLSPSQRTLIVAGAASGFLATAGSIGGPPLALVYARSSGGQVRANLSGFFVVTAAASLAVLVAAGRFGSEELRLSLVLVSAGVLGCAVSGPLRPWVDRGHTHTAVLTLSALAGAGAVVQALFSGA